METSTRFSCTELVFTITNCIIAKLFLTYPSSFSALGASASIMLSIFTVAVGGGLFALIIYLYNNKRADITAFVQKKVWKNILIILIISMFIGNTALFTRSVSESMKISILPASPSVFISIIFILGALICSHTGLKSIIRAHSIILPFTLFMVLILSVSSIKNMDVYNIFPILGNGGKMFWYLWILSGYFSDFIILLLLMPFASEQTTFKSITLKTFFISSAVLVVIISLYTLVIPYDTTQRFFIPVYRIAQYISYETFLSRLEPIFTTGWLLSFFAYVSLYLYMASMLVGRLFNFKSNRHVMYVIAAVIFGLSLVPENTFQLTEWANYFSIIKLIIGIIIPIVLLSIAKYREAKRK